jgi:hypothetical protein
MFGVGATIPICLAESVAGRYFSPSMNTIRLLITVIAPLLISLAVLYGLSLWY